MVFWVKLTLFRIDLSGAVHECGDQMALLPTICYAHPTIMKLGAVVPYLKKIRKICKSCDTVFEFSWYHFLYQKLIFVTPTPPPPPPPSFHRLALSSSQSRPSWNFKIARALWSQVKTGSRFSFSLQLANIHLYFYFHLKNFFLLMFSYFYLVISFAVVVVLVVVNC